jgi:DNA mismatch repair protein MutS
MIIDDYRLFKRINPGHLIFLELGDFYNTFAEDAEVAGRVCGLTVTTKNKIKVAGMPVRAAESYIKRLTDAGYLVAVCQRKKDVVPVQLTLDAPRA